MEQKAAKESGGSEKLLTIAVAAYNGERTLAKALDSCLRKGEDRLEVLVVDDGSTDGTARLAQGYAWRWPGAVRLLRQPNGGYGMAVQAALTAAKGRYFRTLDSDDWLEPEGLTVLLDYLQSCRADLVFTGYRTVADRGMAAQYKMPDGLDPRRVYLMDDPALGALEKYMEIHALTCRTQLLRGAELKLPPHCRYTDMLYTYCAVESARSAAFCPVMLYCYRLGRAGQSVELASYQAHAADYIRVVQAVLSRAERLPGQNPKEQMLRRRARDIAQYQIELFLRFTPGAAVWRSMAEYDRMLRREYPVISGMMQNKNTRLLRCSKYSLYILFCIWSRKKYKNSGV